MRALWRGDLSPLGRKAALSYCPVAYQTNRWGPLRSPAGINPLATVDRSGSTYATINDRHV
ncbi:protein of unknown function [Pseudomonas mediterranea]